MAAWGLAAFENDEAMDWIGDLRKDSVTREVEMALDHVASKGTDDYLEAPDCCCALAAAELVAAALGETLDTAPPEVAALRGYLDHGRLPTMVKSARVVIDRIEQESELRDLLEKAEGLEEWMDLLDALRARLGA